MLRQLLVVCNSSWQRGRCLYQIVIFTTPALSALLTARATSLTQAACPPLRESCVRGADRAAVDTRLFGFTHLKNLLPMWALEGPAGEIHRRLRDPQVLERIRQHPNLISGVGDWSKIVLVDSLEFAAFNGLTFDVIASMKQMTPFDAAMDVLRADVEHLQRPMVLLKTYSESVLRTTYEHPGCMPGSDATTLAPDGPLADEKFHGAYTWASWFLRRMVRETGALTLPDAIHRMTAMPARRLGLADRGRIAAGCHADVAVIDWQRYSDSGTVESPSQLAKGVEHVMVNGSLTLSHGRLTGERTGRLIRY